MKNKSDATPEKTALIHLLGKNPLLGKLADKFDLFVYNERTFEYYDKKEINNLIPKKMSTTKAPKKYKKEIESDSNAPFFKFENPGDSFEGTLLRDSEWTYEGKVNNSFVCADEEGNEFTMPTSKDLISKLAKVWNEGKGKGTEFYAEFLSKEKIEGTNKSINKFKVLIA